MADASNHHKQVFSVDFDYPVIFCRDVFNPADQLLLDTLDRKDQGRRRHRAMVYLDAEVAAETPDLTGRIQHYFKAHHEQLELVHEIQVIPGGEAIKNDYRQIMGMVDTILEYKLCRQSFIIAIGGGAVLDAVGFATSLVHRGLRLIRLPTTVLAQNDAGVGVKNGMNLHGGKNTVGTFAPPFAVINDYDFLGTLPEEHWCSGISEAFKVALIKDRDFFDFLCENADALKRRESGPMETLIKRCAIMHLDHIKLNGDPFEMGTARPLDFGHWSAHKLEGMTGYRVPHGYAVATGIALDSCYAAAKGWIGREDCERILDGLHRCGFPLWFPELERRTGDSLEILQGLADFQEHLGGVLTITFPDGIGAKKEVHEMDRELITQCIEELKQRFQSVAQGET